MSEILDLETVRAWGRRFSNWGRWGADDELGTLNFITPERVLAAARSHTGNVSFVLGTDGLDIGSDAPLWQRLLWSEPPPVATPTEFMPQPRKSPRVSAASPSMKELSGVKLSGPLSSVFTSAVSSTGSRCKAFIIIGSK